MEGVGKDIDRSQRADRAEISRKIDENQIYHKRKTPHIVVILAIQLQYMGFMELLAGLEPATC